MVALEVLTHLPQLRRERQVSNYGVNEDQIHQLGAKLDRLSNDLTEDDRRLLIGVFGLAANSLGNVKGAEASRSNLPSLSEGLRSAFLPSEAARFTAVDEDAVEVTGGIKWSK